MKTSTDGAGTREHTPSARIHPLVESALLLRNPKSRVREIEEIIAQLELNDLQKRFIRVRWLHQALWFETASGTSRIIYSACRLPTIIGSAVLPGFVGIIINGHTPRYLRRGTFALSVLAAIGSTIEQFLHAGDRWRLYRYTAELLTSEGWHFFQLAGPYRNHANHNAAFPDFAERVEEIALRQSDLYLAGMTQDVQPDSADQTRRGLLGLRNR